MADFPSMPLWTDAYLGDSYDLTTEQHGAYLLLLMRAWRMGGVLPDDDTVLARVCKVGLRKWQNKIRKTVLERFFRLVNGAWSQKRLTKELEYVRSAQRSNPEKQSSRGKVRAETSQRDEHGRFAKNAAVDDGPQGAVTGVDGTVNGPQGTVTGTVNGTVNHQPPTPTPINNSPNGELINAQSDHKNPDKEGDRLQSMDGAPTKNLKKSSSKNEKNDALKEGDRLQSMDGAPTKNLKKSSSKNEKNEKNEKNDALFEEFWEIYPRKLDKKRAHLSFNAAIKAVIKRGEAPTVIIDGARRYAKERSPDVEDPKYTKHPTTWLNGDCWENKPQQIRNTRYEQRGSNRTVPQGWSEAAAELIYQEIHALGGQAGPGREGGAGPPILDARSDAMRRVASRVLIGRSTGKADCLFKNDEPCQNGIAH